MRNFYYPLIIVVMILHTSMLLAQITCEDEIAVLNNYEVYAALPNIFTPNNDGINDLLVIYNSFAKQRLIQISDTTANNNILFSSMETDETAYWDGLNDNGEEVPEAAYNLRVDYLFGNDVVAILCRTIYLIRENCIDLSDVELDFSADFDDLNLTFIDTETTLPDCIVDINELSNTNANIQPTLAQNKININSAELVNKLTIYDLSGKIILLKKINNQLNFELRVDEFETGLYYLFLDHGGKYSTHQFFKK